MHWGLIINHSKISLKTILPVLLEIETKPNSSLHPTTTQFLPAPNEL